MKLRMYMDFWPSMAQTSMIYCATTAPHPNKSSDCVRVAFDVHIPDDILFKPDRVANEVSKVVEVQNVISEDE